MASRTPSRDEFKVAGDTITHTPTGKCYEAEAAGAKIVKENAAELGEYTEADLRQMAQQLLAERVRITERLR